MAIKAGQSHDALEAAPREHMVVDKGQTPRSEPAASDGAAAAPRRDTAIMLHREACAAVCGDGQSRGLRSSMAGASASQGRDTAPGGVSPGRPEVYTTAGAR